MENTKQNQQDSSFEIAVLGGGCFWCHAAVYAEVRGVTRVASGYTGGSVPDPTYAQVCTGVHGRYGPRGSGAPGIRSRCHRLPRLAGNLFHAARPHHTEPAGQRCRHAISLRHLLPVGRTGKRGAQGAGRDGRRVGCAHRHAAGAGSHLLSGRGLPPELRRAASLAGLLRPRRHAQGGEIPRHVCGASEVRQSPAPRAPVRA